MANHSTLDQTASSSQQKFSMFHASSSVEAIKVDEEYAAHNYHPLPMVFARASGCDVWDPEGKQYIDFLSAYSAVNQGHCHPKLVQTLCEQAQRLTLSSRAFHNDVFPLWAKKVRSIFNYDMVLPMNTGAEAVETAIKIARKWAYKVKKIPQNRALIFSATGNFHGRTMTAVSLSADPESRDNYGPYIPGIGACCPSTKKCIQFNNVTDLESSLEAHGKVTAAFIVEPIQGEAGVIVPSDNYLVEVYDLCKKYNVLLICDEIQTGIGRTGRNLCHEWAGIKPDMVILGKAISGGMYPVSCVLGSKELMLTIEPGTHGSTYGGNPLGCAISIRALEILETENLAHRADTMGTLLRQGLHDLKSPMIKQIRGKGLLNAIVIDETNTRGHSAWDMCILMMRKGLLTKPTHNDIIRLAPPLVISEEQIREALHIIRKVLNEISHTNDKIKDSYGPK
ncbi:Ornithine aminotransferase [Golovinomyces cichoracearum]|uniref:Ornithine aminotransferase n=1 Tax=Golovinomyces cichoracearum TaxID=62708 RepID=A0A420ITC4_9PEZI|nr:Ornithine aminotransferase [Golovinomyces cichoracearum]